MNELLNKNNNSKASEKNITLQIIPNLEKLEKCLQQTKEKNQGNRVSEYFP